MKNRTSGLIVAGLIILALIGITSMLVANPTGFLVRIAGIGLIIAAVYFVVRLIYKGNPQKKEQRAFLKAARQSKKRLQKKSGDTRSSSPGTLTPLKKSAKAKKKTSGHLTVIDGKKGKKKNRASF